MDEFSRKQFDRITAKDVNDLNKDEKAYIRARRSYLSEAQKVKFADILPSAKPKEDEPKKPRGKKK